MLRDFERFTMQMYTNLRLSIKKKEKILKSELPLFLKAKRCCLCLIFNLEYKRKT